jgi:deazaflavin-dependent oxidoreductase (nitroreductase family)
LAATRMARTISRHVNWKLDPFLLRVSGGRFASTLMFPTGLLETTGAKTGELRRHAAIYFHDGERVIIVASNAGDARHPSWYHNLVASPDVVFGGIAMRATRVIESDELARLWPLADRVFPAFARYRDLAAESGREIPMIELFERE